jgi:nucleotide-binding universal stress UspA family protein
MTTAPTEPARRIVVGIDGSHSSEAALNWALRQADLTGSTIQAVTTWEWPTGGGMGMATPTGFDPKADATKVLSDAIASAEPGHDDVSIESTIVGGPAGMALVEASRGADLLVVGSRGHHELVSVVLGSVSEHCVTHAHSPVLVVRDGEAVSPGDPR